MARTHVADWREPAAAPMLLLALLAVAMGCASIALGAPAWHAVVLLLLAPAAEEIVFRAGLHEALLRCAVNPVLANTVVAVAFAVAHMATRPMPAAAAVILPALAVGWAYQRTRRVAPCIALHAAMNSIWIGWGLVA
jgi:membrane protease YdiL (CAAX protease family)